MAYSVDWLTKVVTIPKADLTLLSASPEIYKLDMLAFWASIHDLQDDEGITYPTIMRSNAPVTISGVTYVRTVEVINGYSIEFEDGQYQVNLVGANNNLLDARVQNQVSINASNSAGAVQVQGIDSATLARVLDLLEADEILETTRARKLLRGTATILLDKTVTGGGAITPVTISE